MLKFDTLRQFLRHAGDLIWHLSYDNVDVFQYRNMDITVAPQVEVVLIHTKAGSKVATFTDVSYDQWLACNRLKHYN